MAVAFAESGWNHTLLKSIEELDMHMSQQKKAKAYPMQVMVTKYAKGELAQVVR